MEVVGMETLAEAAIRGICPDLSVERVELVVRRDMFDLGGLLSGDWLAKVRAWGAEQGG